MAKKDKPQNKSETDSKDKKVSPDDLEKTVIDLDIRHLKESFDETVIVRVPPKEDSDLHDVDFLDEEKTGDHLVKEPPKGESAALFKETTEPFPERAGQEAKPQVKTKVPEQVSFLQAEAEPASASTLRGPEPRSKPKGSSLYLGLSFTFFLLLAEGTIEVLRQGATLRLPAIFCTGFALLLSTGALFHRWSGKTAFLGSALAWFGLIAYSGLRFYTSDPEALHFFKLSLESWMGPAMLVAGSILVLVLSGRRGLGFLPKLLGWIAWILLLLGVGFAWAGRQNLEDGLWGGVYLAKLPLFLRPGVLALALAFPLATIAALLSMVAGRDEEKGFLKDGTWALLGIGLLGSLLGAKLLNRQGVAVPLLSRLVRQNFFGATVLDPATSSIHLQVADGKPGLDQNGWMRLNVAASNSQALGKGRQSWLLVKNEEGRDFVAEVGDYLQLSRGDKEIKGVKVAVDSSRVGKRREVALLINFPSLAERGAKSAAVSAVHGLAEALGSRDRLHLVGAGGVETLDPQDPAGWQKKIDKILTPAEGVPADLVSQAVKKFGTASGLKQLILVTDAAKLPPAEQRSAMAADAKKNQAALSFLVLGNVENPDASVYTASAASSLSFALMSVVAETLGDISLQFPQLAPLPRVKWVRDASGNAAVQGDKLNFDVVAEDPSLIQALQVKVDDDKAIDLDKTALHQSLDLGQLKIRPGPHRLILLLTTGEGDVVSDAASLQYSARRPLKFVKPLDKDTVAGNFNVMFSVGSVPGAGVKAIDLNVDGAKVGQATSVPFMVPFNAAKLSEGIHTLQAVEIYSDGSSETAQIQVNVNPQVPRVQILRPSIGEYLPNLAEIEAQVGGGLFEQVQKVEFLVDGEWIGESLQAPYRLLWSNNTFPVGNYFVQARAYLSSQATATDAVQVQLGQGELVVQSDPAVNSAGMLFPQNVEVLIDASSRMGQPVGSAIKVDLAKAAMVDLLQTLPENVRLNARVLGSGSAATQRNCEDAALLKSPVSELTDIRAQGVFPLSYGLELLGKDLKKAEGSRVGLVITDGWDACGGDPIAVATRLGKEGERLRLHIIYFSDVDPTAESLLKRLAEVTGGRTYKATRQEDLQQAIHDAVQVSFSLYDYKNTPVAVMPLSQNPLTVRTGEYRLEIDTVPPVVKGGVIISAEARKSFTVVHQDGKYEVKGE